MTERRNFIKTVVAGSGSLLSSAPVLANSSAMLPSILSLLLEDDSLVIDCGDVAISGFSVEMQFSNAFTAATVLELETPGGTRVVAGFNPTSPVQADCNVWDLSFTGAELGQAGVRGINLQGTSINPGRYQIFARHGASTTPHFDLQVDAGAASAVDQSNVAMIAGVEQLIGSVNISSGGTPTVRAFNQRDPSIVLPCASVIVNTFMVEMTSSITAELILETPGGSKITSDVVLPSTQTGKCNTWLVSGTQSASSETVAMSLSGTTVNPGRYRLFAQSPTSISLAVGVIATVGTTMLATGGGIQLITNQPNAFGSINISQGGTPTIRLFS